MRLLLSLLLLCAFSAQAAIIGQIDTFEDGTVQGWVVGIGPVGGVHPAPPANIATGGPAGGGDNYLQLTAVGGGGPGSRLSALNLAQWAGDYTAAGIGRIGMDLINLGTTDLSIRLFVENPMGGPPVDTAITDAFLLPAGGGWQHALFNVTPAGLTVLGGDVNVLLANVTALRIFHGIAAGFPPETVTGQLGVDNIEALEIPEPATISLLAMALLCLVCGKVRLY